MITWGLVVSKQYILLYKLLLHVEIRTTVGPCGMSQGPQEYLVGFQSSFLFH